MLQCFLKSVKSIRSSSCLINRLWWKTREKEALLRSGKDFHSIGYIHCILLFFFSEDKSRLPTSKVDAVWVLGQGRAGRGGGKFLGDWGPLKVMTANYLATFPPFVFWNIRILSQPVRQRCSFAFNPGLTASSANFLIVSKSIKSVLNSALFHQNYYNDTHCDPGSRLKNKWNHRSRWRRCYFKDYDCQKTRSYRFIT